MRLVAVGGHALITRTGTTTGGLLLWDPYGQPVDPTTFAIGTTATDDTGQVAGNTLWHQGALKPAESAGSALVVEMGTRLYIPAFGRFLQVDPIEGEGVNDYSWPNDPIGGHDLSGNMFEIEMASGGDGRLANLIGAYGVKKVVGALKPTQRAAANPSFRQKANAKVTAAALLYAFANKADCQKAPNGLIVCGNFLSPGGGGTTYGDVFLTDQPTATVLRNKNLLAHEMQHANQWAGWGGDFPLAYAGESIESTLNGRGRACLNYFEMDASLVWGGYREC